MRRRIATAVAIIGGALCATAAASAGAPTVRWFHSPSGNIQCEVASADSRGTYAYCQTFVPLQTARLGADGHSAVCSHRACPVGDGPEGAPTLDYGRSIRVGVFRCASSLAGVRCAIAATGHGFLIARGGIQTF